MSESFDFAAPDHFTTGAIGPPGQRVFYLQARERGVVVTLKVEKEQVAALAEYLAGLLDRLPTPAGVPTGDLSLIEPVAPAWAVRSLGVGYDQEEDRIVIVAEEQVDEAEDEDESEAAGEREGAGKGEGVEEGERETPGASGRLHVSPGQASAFVERARALVKAGRPACPICGRPMNASGHVCPRSNGHGRD
jgi:uncharacterized repeat protein (TIGR03847 family)